MSIYLIIAEVQTTNFYYEPVREHELMDQLMIVKILEKKRPDEVYSQIIVFPFDRKYVDVYLRSSVLQMLLYIKNIKVDFFNLVGFVNFSKLRLMHG